MIHFTSAISHPESVGLSERYVQMLINEKDSSHLHISWLSAVWG